MLRIGCGCCAAAVAASRRTNVTPAVMDRTSGVMSKPRRDPTGFAEFQRYCRPVVQDGHVLFADDAGVAQRQAVRLRLAESAEFEPIYMDRRSLKFALRI
jgi:hypothetical protein